MIIILSFLFLICVIRILQEVAGLPLWSLDGARMGVLFGTLDTIVSCKTFVDACVVRMVVFLSFNEDAALIR